MASTIDSGIDTGNDSSDSSLQDKFSKMDLELPSQLKLSDSKNDSNSSLCENGENAEQVSSDLTKLNEASSMVATSTLSSSQIPSSPEYCSNFNYSFLNVMTSNEVGEIFVGPYGRDYAARDLVTKMHRMRQALRRRCLRRCSYNMGLGITPLQYGMLKAHVKIWPAVTTNNTDAVREMLMAGITPNCRDTFKRTPLHLAACMGYADMVKLLLDYGADPNAKDSIGNTPLHLAVCTNHVRVVSLLIQAGTRLGEKDLAGHSPLQLAITKLNIMKRALKPNPLIQEQITQVVHMMSDYMKRKEHVEPALLSRLFSVMQVKDSTEEMESNIQELLSNLSLSSSS